MIRPLEYCDSIEHVQQSIDTIDQRILELLDLRRNYCDKAISFQQTPTSMINNDNAYVKLAQFIKNNELEGTHEK